MSESKVCKGCKWQSSGCYSDGSPLEYCIGSPDHEPPESFAHLIDQSRIIKTGFGDDTVYRANDDDECHLWSMLF